MVTGFEVDVPTLLLEVIDERGFKATTTYRIPCLILELCRFAGVPICHIDIIMIPTGIIDIGLIRDEANEAAPKKGPEWRCSH